MSQMMKLSAPSEKYIATSMDPGKVKKGNTQKHQTKIYPHCYTPVEEILDKKLPLNTDLAPCYDAEKGGQTSFAELKSSYASNR